MAENGAERLRVALIIGSTREGRAGGRVGRWFAGQARQREDIEPDVLDLADYEFPACYPCAATPQMRRFTAAVARADAFVVVTPEYNRSFPASLKQAVDYAYDEWHAKPVGFVTYGSGSLGLYAAEALRPVFTELHAVTVRNGVGLDLLAGEPERPDGGGGRARAVRAMLDQLVWWGRALREARDQRPYPV
ncbi:NAD(P)H-dependent oxidoreductase [Streptomyces sp. MP131-18]|uniref:NADPH-dependent FMN reductase n=1 Tax=Streptomyces sp. MP131-18 TaxID=1857892 RepID=UPI0009CC703C|nr:NAD(P)H-dependent oxidoreductase [Streptomyces sp. MP131-18]ONK12923.1 FMN-dependent NADPH-azoreductase [Streptomyces sp. MP131-18]